MDDRNQIVEHDGKRYRISRYGEHVWIDVWRLSSRRTGRWHWVRVPKPPEAVRMALAVVQEPLDQQRA